MGREPKISTRTLSVSPSDDFPQSSRAYRLRGTLMDGDFQIGLSVQSVEDGSLDDLPEAVHGIISEMAENSVDVDHVKDDTTDEIWPTIGMLTITPDSEDTLSLFVEWMPQYMTGDDED